MINKELLYGIFDLYKIETTVNGGPVSEAPGIGMVTFRRDQQMSAVSGAPVGVMAYTGQFGIEGEDLVVKVSSCVVKEWVGTNISRKIVTLDKDQLVIETGSPDGSICSKLFWKRSASL